MKPAMLFLAHRFPFPPNKGERIRAWNLLQHFAKTWDIHFACLSDDPADARHHDAIRPLCASFATFPIDKRTQKLRALAGFRPGRPLMLDYNHHAGLAAWTRATLAAQRIDLAYIFSTAMAPYILEAAQSAAIPRILDMQDVDSEKWREYAPTAGFPMRQVWAREATCWAKCKARKDYHHLPGVTKNCTEQVRDFCEEGDRGGFGDALWSECSPN